MYQKHKKTGTRIYNIYREMKTRCYNKNDYHYKWYGEKGIKICDEWLNSFISFYNWSIENGYKDDLTIDRIDNNKNYEPNNCRWVSHKIQCQNRKSNVFITINGETKILTEWSRISGIDRKAKERKLKKGYTGEKLLQQVKAPCKLKIIQKNLNGNIIKIWDSLNQINLEKGYSKTSIANVCKNKKNYKTAYGYKWEYKKD